MFLRFLWSSSEVWKSQPCQTMPSFNEDSEPGHCIALQDVCFLPMFSVSVSMARLSLGGPRNRPVPGAGSVGLGAG